MLFNKWINFGISALGGLSALSSALDWNSVLSPQAAAGVAAGALVIRTITAVLAPASNAAAAPTGSSIVTHS